MRSRPTPSASLRRPVSPQRHRPRELWLARAAEILVREFELVVPPVVIRTDVNMRGNTGPAVGLCWDDNPEVRLDLCASLTDPTEILAVLLHELCHAEIGPLVGHRAPYAALHRRVGFVGRPTGYEAGERLVGVLEWAAEQLGPYPGLIVRDRHRATPSG